MNKAICRSLLKLSTIYVLLLSLPIYLYGQDKLKVSEIVSKHVASIGTPDAIAAAANRKIEGTAQARRIQNNFLTVEGKSLLASATDKFLLLMAFEATSDDAYKLERISFDGKKTNIPYVTESSRSAIGSFVYDYPEIAKQGLLGGPLFSSWALLDAAGKIGNLSLQGKEKIGDIEAYKIRCVPRGGSALTIKLYFDTQTFRLVRTEYQRTVTAGTVGVDEGRVTESRYKLIEDFSDYKQINGVTLPVTYKITFRVDTSRLGREFEWVMKFNRFVFDQQIQPDVFR